MLLKDLKNVCYFIYDSLNTELSIQGIRHYSEATVTVQSMWVLEGWTYCVGVSPVFHQLLGLRVHVFLRCSFCTEDRCFSCQPVEAVPDPFPLCVWDDGDLLEIYLAR